MQNFSVFLDNWLRRIGAFVIVVVGFMIIVLSFLSREISPARNTGLVHHVVRAAAGVENWFYDLRTTRFYQHAEKSPNIVILEMTDNSLAKVGRWPWTRTIHAKMIDRVREYGAKVLMFDTLFPEPESPEADQAMFDAIQRFTAVKGNSIVLGYGLADDPSLALKPFPEVLYSSAVSGTTAPTPMRGSADVDKNNFAAPKLQESNALFGFISASPDIDGIFRQAQLVSETEKVYLPSLGFAGFSSYFSDGKEKKMLVEPAPSGSDYLLKVQDGASTRSVLLNSRGELKIRYFGGVESFVRVPADAVILEASAEAQTQMKRIFAGKAVLFGSSAFGANDLRHTPVDSQIPGMYMHANLFHALDQNYFFQQENTSMLLSFALYLLAIIAVLALFRIQEPLLESAGAAVVVSGAYAADYFYFAPQGYYIRLFSCIAGALALHAWFTILNVFKEAREKKKIRATFTRYVSPKIVKEMLSNPEKLRVGGEKKEITMLFSDVRDFTSISEKLGAQQLATLLNVYMGKMTDILFETDGTLDKYIGDALVGFWGAPLDVPEHAYQGVKGASLMLEALPAINDEFERRNFPRINVGIGLNTGEVSVGNMGSDKIFQYTALGDSMNLASRLESLTKNYGVNLMISEFTYEKLGARRAEFVLRPLDLVQVKGKTEAVKIYEVVPTWRPWAGRPAALEKYTRAYEELYLKKKFSEAAALFDEVLAEIPEDKNLVRLRDSAVQFLNSPPPENWTGVTIFTTK